jgi:hypothetical protein
MIYENQPLRIRIKADIDVLADYSTLEIKYRDPDGSKDVWTAKIYDADHKYIYYDVPINILSFGDWTVWSFITFNDGKPFPGDPVTFNVLPEGKSK